MNLKIYEDQIYATIQTNVQEIEFVTKVENVMGLVSVDNFDFILYIKNKY